MPTDPKKKKKTDREKLNKLVKKRKKTNERLEKLKDKDGKIKPLRKLRTKIQEKKKKRIQKKINANPKAQEDRKKGKEQDRVNKRRKMLDDLTKVLRKKKETKKPGKPTKDPLKHLRKNVGPDGTQKPKGKRKINPQLPPRPRKKNDSTGKRMMKKVTKRLKRDLSNPMSPSVFDASDFKP
ncbi:MAG: hypothetical protein GY760_22380 [Deltaproteobacteria bacterium]|jgi:hypothetical protein|nr:hypothetical protein [Deltaproteobacteria bacterium]